MQSDRELLKQALHTLEGWANHGEWVWPESALEQAKRNTTEAITALRERLAQPEFDDDLQSAAMTQTVPKLAQPECCCQEPSTPGVVHRTDGPCYMKEQPEQWEQFYPDMGKPLDRMAENARELGLDYEPVQEPVAWQWLDTGTFRKSLPASAEPSAWRALYTTPPRREWVGLTEEEIAVLWDVRHDIQGFARATEAKLREKNA